MIAGYWRRARTPTAQLIPTPPGPTCSTAAPRRRRRVQEPEPGRSLSPDRREGPRCLLQGRIASEIVAFSDKNGGLFSLKDFADHTSTWVEPVSTTYRGYDVWEIPPPGPGHRRPADAEPSRRLRPQEDGAGVGRLLAPVRRGEEAGLRRPGALLRRSRLSPRCRSTELISKPYADERRKLIDMDKALTRHAGRRPEAGARRHDLSVRGRQGSQLRVADPEQLLSASAPAWCRATSASPCRIAARCSPSTTTHAQPPGAAQAAVPHDHPGDGDEGRQAVVRLRRHGRRHAAAGARAGAGQPDRLRHERAGSRRGAAHRARRLRRRRPAHPASRSGGTVKAERGISGEGDRAN